MSNSATTTHPAFPSHNEERHFLQELVKIISQINKGSSLEDILNGVFESFASILPYDRIGFSLIDEKSYWVQAHWARCNYVGTQLNKGYKAPLRGSSLEKILQTGTPRIITDLANYAKDHPHSESTQIVLAEGILSSLTCPLIRGDKTIGFLFFSSRKANTYKKEHVEVFSWLAQPLVLALEKAQLYERLVALNNEKNLLLGVAAHDLRSPIAQIQTLGELLASDPLTDADRKEMADLVVVRCQSMLSLLHDLLDLSAIEAGRLPLHPEMLDLKTFCLSLLKGIDPIARAKKITLRFEGEPLEISCDPARLAQAVDNFLTNAIKYSPQGSTVTVRAGKQGTGWHISVTDQGQGIAPADLPKLFKPFSRTETLPTGGEEQFGLGLAIVKKIVEAHGGTVSVESALGDGSTFELRMPTLGR